MSIQTLYTAATGMQARYGGDEQPQLQRYAVNDYATGFLGAYAVALAVLHHRRTGRGQQVDAALAYTATTLQSVFMQNFAGKTWDEPRGQDSLGDGPLHRAYEASDGWFFLAARDSQLPAIAAIEGLDGIGALSGAELERALEQRFPVLGEEVGRALPASSTPVPEADHVRATAQRNEHSRDE